MGFLISPKPRRNRPPQGSVRVRWGDDLARGLVFCLSGADGKDAVSGLDPAITTTTRDGLGSGLAWTAAGGSSSLNYGTYAATAGLGRSAATWYFRGRISALTNPHWGSHSDVDNDRGWNLQGGNTGIAFRAIYASGDLTAESASSPPLNQETAFICTYDGTTNSSGVSFYIDNVASTLINTSNGSGTPADATAESLLIGRTNWDSTSGTQLISEVRIYNRILADVERYALFDNPWTMLEWNRHVVYSLPGKVSSTGSAGDISPADSFAATAAALKQGAGAISPADSFAATSKALKQSAGDASPADSFAATSKALKAAAGAVSPTDSFDATTKALKASAGGISPADSFDATTQALKASAGDASPADSFAATSNALKQAAGAISPADNFSAGSTKLAASAGSFSPADVIEATSAALKSAVGNFSPGDSFDATANTSGSQGNASPADSFAATSKALKASAGSWLPADDFAAAFLELGAGAGSFSPAEAFTATGAALRAGAGLISPGDSFAGTSAKLAAAVGAISPADSFGATGASLFKFVGNISPPDDFSARSPSAAGSGSSSMFLTTAR